MKQGKYWRDGCMIFSERGLVCEVRAGYDQTRGEDGELILKALNGYEALVKLAVTYYKEAVDQGAQHTDLTAITKALTLAGAEKEVEGLRQYYPDPE